MLRRHRFCIVCVALRAAAADKFSRPHQLRNLQQQRALLSLEGGERTQSFYRAKDAATAFNSITRRCGSAPVSHSLSRQGRYGRKRSLAASVEPQATTCLSANPNLAF